MRNSMDEKIAKEKRSELAWLGGKLRLWNSPMSKNKKLVTLFGIFSSNKGKKIT